MNALAIIADGYFDGTRHHERGPFTFEVVDGRIEEVLSGDRSDALATRHRHLRGEELPVLRAPFVMPGLVEAHCHLFLDGAELDFEARKNYLNAPRETMLSVGRRSLEQNLAAGVTLIRDAGDIHGINAQLQAETAGRTGGSPVIISAGRALRKAGRYGSFMALEATDSASIVHLIHQLAPTAGQLKILLTGIIDFERGQMKGGVQFDLDETRLIVRTARELGLRTFAHCSGLDGLKIAVEAGIDSIEHGFFMTRDILFMMADKGIVWVPTFSPVQFQHRRPELAGWSADTVAGLRRILDNHREHLAFAAEIGVAIVAGSDAGSYGVPHGRGVIDELFFQHDAGLSIEQCLASATSVPRRVWGCEPADLAAGQRANLVALEGSPFDSIEHLRHMRFLVHDRKLAPGAMHKHDPRRAGAAAS